MIFQIPLLVHYFELPSPTHAYYKTKTEQPKEWLKYILMNQYWLFINFYEITQFEPQKVILENLQLGNKKVADLVT